MIFSVLVFISESGSLRRDQMDLVAEGKGQDSSGHALAMDDQAECSGTVALFHALLLSSGDLTLCFRITSWLPIKIMTNY